MASRHKSRVIVLDDDGRLAGIVSLTDVAERDAEDRAIRTIRRVLEREVRPEAAAAGRLRGRHFHGTGEG